MEGWRGPRRNLLVSRRRRWRRQEQKQIDDPQLQPGSRPSLAQPPARRQSPSNFRLFVHLKQRLYTISLTSRSGFQVVGRRPKSVYSRTKAVGDKKESAALPSPSSWLCRAERSAACRGEALIVCALLGFHRCLGPTMGWMGCSHPGARWQEAVLKWSGG